MWSLETTILGYQTHDVEDGKGQLYYLDRHHILVQLDTTTFTAQKPKSAYRTPEYIRIWILVPGDVL